MSEFVLPEQCSWSKLQCADDTSVKISGSDLVNESPTNISHRFISRQELNFHGVTIPISVTTRDFSATWSINYPVLSRSNIVVYYDTSGGQHVVSCTDGLDEARAYSNLLVKEELSLENSTLHYMDHRYKVALYRYQKETLSLNKQSNELAWFKTEMGSIYPAQAQIRTEDYTTLTTEEWRLIVDGKETVLSTRITTDRQPFGPRNDGTAYTEGFANGFYPDKEVRLILLFPNPPSNAIPLSPEVVRLGFYDYNDANGGESELVKEDGGKDMYYPRWCRYFQEDKVWRQMADRKYQIDWLRDPVNPSPQSYEAPDISVSPLPVGSFARHPVVGDVYQFLLSGVAYSSSDLLAVIKKELPKDEETTNPTLIYPISLI